ncbi:MAG: hypothetical protein JRI45_04400 [Deltaproteobacteria bacterium]|nr:hypothetical protein [Deltaproteobacteria bacterium]MBW2068217.1 hypothetical protein [Deltaproteobacteria bacterium]
MEVIKLSEYDRRHLETQKIALKCYDSITESERLFLYWLSIPYLMFRQKLDRFTKRFFALYCQEQCFVTGRSACCGFESIMVFFADEIINLLWGDRSQGVNLINRLAQGNKTSSHCVFLGNGGCLWGVRPISCAMFFCDEAKKQIFAKYPNAEIEWNELLKEEKNFTWPDKPILFDVIERFFIRKGFYSPHMHFHFSPGLRRIKEKSGI